MKKVRFSGKNSGNLVRFVRRVSTSVSAKSVLTVADASTFAPMRWRDVEARLEVTFDARAAPECRRPP